MDLDWLIIKGFLAGLGAGFVLGGLLAGWLTAPSGGSTPPDK